MLCFVVKYFLAAITFFILAQRCFPSSKDFAFHPKDIFPLYNKFTRHEQVCLMRLRFERYFSHHRAKREKIPSSEKQRENIPLN